jgi:hypothetical protein
VRVGNLRALGNKKMISKEIKCLVEILYLWLMLNILDDFRRGLLSVTRADAKTSLVVTVEESEHYQW